MIAGESASIIQSRHYLVTFIKQMEYKREWKTEQNSGGEIIRYEGILASPKKRGERRIKTTEKRRGRFVHAEGSSLSVIHLHGRDRGEDGAEGQFQCKLRGGQRMGGRGEAETALLMRKV